MTSDEAIKLAEAAARAEGWEWKGTVRASPRRPLLFGKAYWEVVSNADKIGSGVRVKIEDATGKVLSKTRQPR